MNYSRVSAFVRSVLDTGTAARFLGLLPWRQAQACGDLLTRYL